MRLFVNEGMALPLLWLRFARRISSRFYFELGLMGFSDGIRGYGLATSGLRIDLH